MNNLVDKALYETVYCIYNESGNHGTCFTVKTRKNKIAVVTARHLFKDVNSSKARFDILSINGKIRMEGTIVNFDAKEDVALILPDQDEAENTFLTTNPIERLTNKGSVMITSQAFYLGFPLHFYENSVLKMPVFHGTNFYVPLVKSGIIAGYAENDGVYNLFIDTINNAGFSGSPLCVPDNGTGSLKIAGIVCGYWYDANSTDDVILNSGIAYAIGIEYVVGLLDKL